MDSESRKSNRAKGRQSIAHVPSLNSRTENATADIAALQRAQEVQVAKKKLRGKSIGPGGLEALTETSGNVTKVGVFPGIQRAYIDCLQIDQAHIRSILKPTVPLTPPKVIPSFDELRTKRSTSKPRSPTKVGEELLIDFSTPGPGRSSADVLMTGAETVLDPFSPTQQQPSSNKAISAENDEDAERRRKAEKQLILEQRAARRKSMASRRVSFAPEATLHTWSVMEMAEDSTTSSASNSTRRQSAITNQQSPRTGSSPVKTPSSDKPETALEQVDEPQVPASPAHQRELHQKKRRRSSTGPQAQLEGSIDDSFSSSPSGDIVESSPVRIDDGVDSDSDTDGDTAMSMDDATSHSMQSSESESSTQTSLDERLRLAASQAGTRGIDYDENGDDVSMEMATATITQAFQPWAKNSHDAANDSAMQDQENIDPFSPASKARQAQPPGEPLDQDDTQDMSMDVTHAVGGILPGDSSPAKGRRKSVLSRRKSTAGKRTSSGGDSAVGDETMDFTTVGGGILSKGESQSEGEISDEELTMEFTAAVGGVMARNRRESTLSLQTDENDTMEMTAAVGGILAPIEEQTEPLTAENTRTFAMDMTKAVGGILGAKATPQEKTRAKHLMQEETDAGQLNLSPTSKVTDGKPSNGPAAISQGLVTSIASETGSPDIALKPRLSGRSRQTANTASTTPKFSPRRAAPSKSPVKATHQMTPTKQLTPLPVRPDSPNKTPIIASVTHRGASPKKLFKEEIKARQSPASTQKPQQSSLFSKDEHTGRHTPSVVLQATRPRPRRRSSGMGIDQEGFGSPRVSEMLDRRESIGDSAAAFKLGGQPKARIRFEDPREIEQELDAERAEEERRESGRFVMEQEANEQQEENATLQLKEMIDSMSPKKSKASKLKGRKSLAPGGARGLLGKRPAELDIDEEDADGTPKRLKVVARDGSPVKKVHLPKPPTKEETTGRLTGAQQQQLASMSLPSNQTPAMNASPGTAASPHAVGRYRDVPIDDTIKRPESFEDKLDNVIDAIDVSTAAMESQGDEKISLQNFLNMTNIHFIELSTTKRRQTMAPTQVKRPSEEARDSSTEAIFSAAATTLPLLELYQHATRELKSYISTGRKIIRSIEAETLAEQPPLFREYVDARPDVRQIMDNQFRNGKTNARLQSKEGWYMWRSQLVDGLKSGLEGIKKGMQADLTLLQSQSQQLDAVVPALHGQHQALEAELKSASEALTELDSVDTDALDQIRQELHAADEVHKSKTSLLESLRRQMTDKTDTLTSAEELKTEMNDQIAEADRVRQEYRGWPVHDVLALKANVDKIETEAGWRLHAAEEDEEDTSGFGVALTLMYRHELRFFFYPAVYQTQDGGRRRSGRRSRSVSGPNAPISLAYAPVNEDEGVSSPSNELSTEKRFFLQLIRSQLQAFSMMPKGSVSSRTILTTISTAWDTASKITQEIRLLNLAAGITSISIVSDDKVSIKTKLIMSGSRIDVEFTLAVALLNDGAISSSTTVTANGIYGDQAAYLSGSKARKVQTALTKEVENSTVGNGSWIAAIHAFERWLQMQSEAKPEVQAKVDVPLKAAQVERPSTQPPRSPLAVKKPNTLQPKRLPVPKKSTQPPAPAPATSAISNVASMDKENIPPASLASQKHVVAADPIKVDVVRDVVTPIKGAPAIPPDMQEELMKGSPIRRVGALRRSPV